MLAQITPTQVDMLERLAALPLQALLLLLVIVLCVVIYKLWQRILVLEQRLDDCLQVKANAADDRIPF
jgi:hypothetical protein